MEQGPVLHRLGCWSNGIQAFATKNPPMWMHCDSEAGASMYTTESGLVRWPRRSQFPPLPVYTFSYATARSNVVASSLSIWGTLFKLT